MYDDASIRLHGFQAIEQVTTELYSLLLPLHLLWSQGPLYLGGTLGQQREFFLADELLQTFLLLFPNAYPRKYGPPQVGIWGEPPSALQDRAQALTLDQRVDSREAHLTAHFHHMFNKPSSPLQGRDRL